MTLLFLASTPVAYGKLKSEIANAISEGRISSPIKDKESRQLPYLQAVIKEGLRTFPVVTATFFKQVPKGGDVINDCFLPEGTEVGHNVMGVMRAKKYWGEDADVFRPERWLEVDEKTHENMVDALEILWGHGKFKCLGRAIVQVELNKVFVEVSCPASPSPFFCSYLLTKPPCSYSGALTFQSSLPRTPSTFETLVSSSFPRSRCVSRRMSLTKRNQVS